MSSDESSTASGQSTPSEGAAATEQRPAKKSMGRSEAGQGEADDSTEIQHAVASTADAASKAFTWDPSTDRSGQKKSQRRKSRPGGERRGNELSSVIPGYTAPMRLEAASLRGVSGASIAELRRRAAREDSTRSIGPAISILKKEEGASFDPAAAARRVKTPSSIAIQKSTGRGGGRIPTSFSSSFRKAPKKRYDGTAGSGWFGMDPTPMTDQLKTDLAMIRNRNYLDPKKFYKSSDGFNGKVLQVGTVIEGSAEYFSGRLAKRDRRQNLTEEIMADTGVSKYAKRKYNEIQVDKAKPKRKVNKRGRNRR